MVQSKADRERQKLITDKCQSLIEVLLKEDDNKYCVDCDAKGPRWASWNLGIFLCIRCAGIHRNLGVHISKVKSVNLDAWTPEHVAYVQRMGNSRARAIYEANLPDDFRRPQTDTALESFIRAKYEHKKYIAQDYVDPGPPLPAFNIDEELKRMKEQKRNKVAGSTLVTRTIPIPDPPSTPKPRPSVDSTELQNKVKLSTPGLIDVETVAAAVEATSAISSTNNSTIQTPAADKSNSKKAIDLLMGLDLNSTSEESKTTNTPFGCELPKSANVQNILDLDLDFSQTSTTSSAPQANLLASQPNNNVAAKKVLDKESILSLYSYSSGNTFANKRI